MNATKCYRRQVASAFGHTLQSACAARGLSRKNSQRYAWLIYMKSDQIIPAVIPGSLAGVGFATLFVHALTGVCIP
jgi:hypothetical protein